MVARNQRNCFMAWKNTAYFTVRQRMKNAAPAQTHKSSLSFSRWSMVVRIRVEMKNTISTCLFLLSDEKQIFFSPVLLLLWHVKNSSYLEQSVHLVFYETLNAGGAFRACLWLLLSNCSGSFFVLLPKLMLTCRSHGVWTKTSEL